MAKAISAKKILHGVFLTSSFFTLHVALVTFINSSFLEKFVSLSVIGPVFIAASAANFLLLALMPRLIGRFGNFKVTSAQLLGAIISLGAMAFAGNATVAIAFFIAHTAIIGSLLLNLDIYIEEYSSTNTVGGIRGTYLTVGNAAWVLSQIIVAIVLTDGDYWKIYVVAVVCSLISLMLCVRLLRRVPDVPYKKSSWLAGARVVFSRWNVRHILAVNLLLQFFFGWMTIYTPIYLHERLGFDWSQIGIIFTVMLLPYVILELPLGKIADRWLGEKELLIVGFLIMAISTAAMSITTSASFLLWTALLFATRIGCATVEVMNETYFFKKVTAEDTTTVEFFRMTRPLGYMLAPAIGSLCLLFVSEQYLFLVLGVITLYGVYASSKIIDTK